MATILQLPASLDTAAATPLLDAVREQLASAGDLHLDGSGVTELGQACLQVLLGARSAAAKAGLSFSLAQPSEAMSAMLKVAGCEDLAGETF